MPAVVVRLRHENDLCQQHHPAQSSGKREKDSHVSELMDSMGGKRHQGSDVVLISHFSIGEGGDKYCNRR